MINITPQTLLEKFALPHGVEDMPIVVMVDGKRRMAQNVWVDHELGVVVVADKENGEQWE